MTNPLNRRFGLELQKYLNSRTMMEMDLVRAMTAIGNRISRQYINMILHNTRTPPPELIDRISDALKLSRQEREILHRAGALDSGYRIGILRG